MSDPFSAAASAVGVISLGLQVCQHLVTYCQAFKSYDRDIEMIRITALGLRQPLKDLRDLIEESQGVNPEITADLGEKALSLASMVGNLKSMVGQLDVGISTTGFAGRVKGHLGKAIYPFRRATLQDMLQDLHKIQAILQTTLSIYSTRIMRRVEVVQETLLEEVKQMRLDMQAIPSKQIPAPALIRSWCDCHSACSELIEDTHFKPNTRPIGPEALNNAGCDVELPRTQLQVNKARQSKKALVRTYRYTCTPLRLAITAFFSMSTGAGGFSIAPALTLQATLKFEGSIADQMMNRIFKKRPDDAEKVISSFIGRLQSAIIKGDMTPSALYLNESGVCLSLFDVNICPKPVITPSIDLIQIQYGWTTEGDPGLLPSIWTLTRFLVDHGALPNNSGYHGLLGGLIRHFVFDEELFTLAFYLVDHGGPWAPNFLDLTFTARSNIWYIFSRDESLISVPRAARIIFQKSEEGLKSALEQRAIMPDDVVLHYSLLELSIGWPKGIQILLASGASALGARLGFVPGYRPRETDPYFESYYSSYKILLDAGCGIRQYYLSDCDGLEGFDSPRLLSLLINELVKRRRRLCTLARSCLRENEIKAFRLHEDKLPDNDASKICKAIGAHGKAIDPSLLVGPSASSLYHDNWGANKAMQSLYNAGFKEPDSPDSNGVTLLMTGCTSPILVWHVRSICWLISAGADVRRKLPQSPATVSHLLSVRVAEYFFLESQSWCSLYFPWKINFPPCPNELFPLPYMRDSCICACSSSGCTIFSVALRRVMSISHWKEFSGSSSSFRQLLDLLIHWTRPGTTTNQALIRSLTFDALGLMHTCCIEIGNYELTKALKVHEMIGRTPEELAEITEENKQGVEILENLISEFEAKYNELSLTIWEFLEGYWHTRMVEYLCEHDPYGEEHDREARSMGVFLQPEEGVPLDRVSLLIGRRVKEIESVVTDSEDDSEDED